MWLELICKTHRFEVNGVAREVFEPFEITEAALVGELRPDRWQRFRPAGEALIFETMAANSAVDTKTLTHGTVLELNDGAVVRAIRGPRASCGFPTGFEWPNGPWDDATLQVLGDRLLEAGYDVGRRYVARFEAEDDSWLGAFAPHVKNGKAEVTWRHGVADACTLSPWAVYATPLALTRHAVMRPLRHLTLDDSAFGRPLNVVEMLISLGGLPCLETLRVGGPSGPAPDLEKQFAKLPGFRAAFPLVR